MTASCLALIVGANPLPNYLAAKLLAEDPGWERAVLFFTPETEPVKKRLAEALLPLGAIEDRCVRDAGDPESVRQAWDRMPTSVHLHYTGGTKAMAVHLYEAWLESGEAGPGRWKSASYLDERSGAIRFADGTERPLNDSPIQLDLQFLRSLHGLDGLTIRPPRNQGLQLPADLDAMVEACLEEPERAAGVYEALPEKCDAFKASSPIELRGFGLSGLSRTTVPEEGWSQKERSAWWHFLRGDWLEIWVGGLAREIIEPQPVAIGVTVWREKRPFELDVVAIRGHRLYLISCTTDSTVDRCKTKLFEAAFRARQLGGDLARASLACLYDQPSLLRQDVAASWEPPNVPEVFGLQHLREWQAGQPESLARWLES